MPTPLFEPTMDDAPILDAGLNARIDAALVADDETRAAAHTATPNPWGPPPDDLHRLSAGRLAWPLQWQVLKALGCPQRDPDLYAQRLFLRGRQVEDWLTAFFPEAATQVPVVYRNVVGYIDVQMPTGAELGLAAVPLEIKSVSNMKFKRIKSQGPDRSHALQACCYACAVGAPSFGVIYVAADDFRVLPFLARTTTFKPAVDAVIGLFETWKRVPRYVPVFDSVEKWHANPKYASYPEWVDLDHDACQAKYAAEHENWQREAVA